MFDSVAVFLHFLQQQESYFVYVLYKDQIADK